MASRSWFQRLFTRVVRTSRKAPPRFQPRLDTLEERLAPAILTVNSTADTANATDAYLSLREAVAIVNSATLPNGLSSAIMNQISGTLHDGASDTIQFDSTIVTPQIALGSGQMELSLPSTTATITIDGGTAGVTVNANQNSRLFQVDSGVQAMFSNLTLINGGNVLFGGAIENQGTLTVNDCTLSNNSAGGGGGSIDSSGTLIVSNSTVMDSNASLGGGIDNTGTLTVSGSTVSADGATSNGGGIYNAGTMNISNSTFEGDSVVNGGGGGIDNENVATITNCTLSNNSAGSIGGGIANSGTLTLDNTIVANSSSGGDINTQFGTLTGSHNLVKDGSGGLSDTITGDPKLGLLAFNGGPTETMALQAGSLAIDAGDNSLAVNAQGNPLTTDQRGLPRIVGGTVDIGAYEVQEAISFPTTILPGGTYGTAYSQTITATEAGYTGSFTFTVSLGTLPTGLSLASDGTLSGTPTTVSTFTFTVTAMDSGGFTGSQEYTVAIQKADLYVTAFSASKIYGQIAIDSGSLLGVVNNDGITASFSSAGDAFNAAVGAYPITLSLSDPNSKLSNYTVHASGGILTVLQAPLFAEADPNSKTYGQVASDFGLLLGVLNNDGITASFSSAGDPASAAVGAYSITPSLSDPNSRLSNYHVMESDAILTVSKADLYVTAVSASKVYGEIAFDAGSLLGVVNNDGITASFSSAGDAASAPVGTGSYTITANLSDPNNKLSNYTVIETNATLTVIKANLYVTAAPNSKTYGQTASDTGTLIGVVNNDGITASFSSTGDPASAPVGAYPITPSLSDPNGKLVNYTVHETGSILTVNAATLSASAVNFSATAGAPFSGTVATFTNADPFGSAASYTALINWGDGSTSAGTITGTGSKLTVTGAHTFADPINRVVSVQISHKLNDTTTATVNDTATVTSLGQGVVKGVSGGIGFWNNKNGQALIASFNGGSSATALANWLSATFANLYGTSAGSNNLTGKSNALVGAYFLTLFKLGGAPAQVLSAALDVYATTASLGGSAAAAYGFTVSATGLGARSFNVGKDGSAFSVANNSTLNVYELLQAVNKKAVNGVLYGGNATLQSQAADLFDSLSTAGGI